MDAPDPQLRGRWGERLATVEDVNGDGVNELLVALPRYDVAGVTDAGRVYLLDGKTRSVIYAIHSPELQAGARFGFWISVLGDVTGDGSDDFAVGTDSQDVYTGTGTPCGAPEPNGCNEDQGKAWVFSGRTGALLYALNNPQPQGAPGNAARFGSRIGRAGDLTGDGRSEVIVGASSNDVPAGCGNASPAPAGCRKNVGQAFIFNGATGALLRTLDLPDPPAPCSALFPTLSFCGTLGNAVQGVGDTDGDGVTDQLVDAPSYNVGRGRMYVFSGRTGDVLLRIDDPEPAEERWFGFQDAAPLAPGDVNHDGFADIYGGRYSERAGDTGRAFVFNGKTGALLYALDDPTPEVGGAFGWSMARTDYNRDGTPDLYVGQSIQETLAGSHRGGTYVFDGRDGSLLRAFELPASDVQPPSVPPAALNLGPDLGWSIAAPGDLNSDGEPDYVAGTPFYDVDPNIDQGRLYVFASKVLRAPTSQPAPAYRVPPPTASAPFAGCPTTTANVIRGSAASERINGTPRADRIFAGTGDDTVDGLAADDCIDLGPGADRGQGGDGDDLILGGLGKDRIAGSNGNDNLRGGGSADRLIGGFGSDRLHGQSGADRILGERGRDRINGGSSGDRISGGSSGDRIAGDQGGDRISGGSGRDSLKGNSGGDRIDARDGQRDRINCGSGRDRVVADRIDVVAGNCERVQRR